ncbi:hypothetical protein FGLOB1_13237 [Fusarium globosum]|uniref:Myb-like domain-containing protein n=1 Tax=Fusarium globosum TaxID=78864 RepID=A0A8H5XNU4_9HYPO|nr:hypothetical protein FGLOB1_13237 [Fusarium globosum]
MTSFVNEPEEQKLSPSSLPSPSQLRMIPLHNTEADSALGTSRDTAICILSDIDSDTEDEDNASQQLNGSRPYGLESTPDFLDLTAIEYGVTESGATVGARTAKAVSPAQGDTVPAWPNEPVQSCLGDAELSQQSYEVDYLLFENTPTESQDNHFETPPTSPESQPYRFAVNKNQLQPEAAIQQEETMFDAVSAYDVCDSSHRRQDCPLTGAQSPRTVTPVDVVQASFQENEIPAGNSRENTVPEVNIPSREMSCHEPCPGQDLDDTRSASTYVESEYTEAGSGSDAPVLSTSPSLRRFRHKPPPMHKTLQHEGGDAGSEVIGNESRTCRLGSQQREKSPSPLPNVENPDLEDGDLDDAHLGRKRPKVSKPFSCASTSSQSSEPRGPTAQAQQLQTRTQTSGHSIRSPTPSRETLIPPVTELFAQFEEWPLGGAVLKRITEGSKTTFQLQFEWDAASCQPYGHSSLSRLKRKRLPDTSHLLSKSRNRSRPRADNSLSTSDTIYVADPGIDASSSDDNMSNGSDSEYNSDRDIVKESRYQAFRRQKVQRRRWTREDNDLLRQLKEDKVLDSEIATILKRTESGVKQHWDIIGRALRYEKTKEA